MVLHVLQHTVDAVAHTHVLFQRLDVNITRPRFEGFGEHVVHESDDRRIFGWHGIPHAESC